jgi:steroid delta-isomerase-like uncharacterized protein
MSEANKQLVKRWFEEVWNQKSESAIDAMRTSNSLIHGFPEPDATVCGVEAFKAVHRNFCGAFPDLHVSVEDVLCDGDRVAARFKATMTHQGDQLGFPATGKTATLHGSTFVVVRDGKILEGWNHMDMGSLIASLKS